MHLKNDGNVEPCLVERRIDIEESKMTSLIIRSSYITSVAATSRDGSRSLIYRLRETMV